MNEIRAFENRFGYHSKRQDLFTYLLAYGEATGFSAIDTAEARAGNDCLLARPHLDCQRCFDEHRDYLCTHRRSEASKFDRPPRVASAALDSIRIFCYWSGRVATASSGTPCPIPSWSKQMKNRKANHCRQRTLRSSPACTLRQWRMAAAADCWRNHL